MAEDLPTGVTWHHPEWLMVNAGLNPHNVMDYFSESPFWDKNSNNATLKMQTQFNALSSSDMDLKSMTGIEFELIYERWPALFIIRKQRRRSPTETIPLAVYYILDGIVHQSPDLYGVIANRMLTSLYHLSSALAEAKKHVEFHPAIGYTWKTDVDGADVPTTEKTKTTRPEQEQEQERTRALKESPEFRAHLDQIVARCSEVPDKLRERAAALARAGSLSVGGKSIHGTAEGSVGETTTRGGGMMTSVREALSKTAAQSPPKTELKQQRRRKGEGEGGVYVGSSSAGGGGGGSSSSKRKKQKRG